MDTNNDVSHCKRDGLQTMKSESLQQKHYDAISDLYISHYDDEVSFEYRQKFIYSKMFRNLKLSDMTSLDAMCGGGAVSKYLSHHAQKVTGLDLSENILKNYKTANPSLDCVQGSIMATPFPENSFDMVTIIGGLHHIQPNVNGALEEIHRILRKDGTFVCFEPPKWSLLNFLRAIWYKLDPYFEENEAAIDVMKLVKDNQDKFSVLDISYGGGPAYFIVFNSMILRTPKPVKKFLKKILFPLDRIFEVVMPSFFSAYVVIRLKKK